VSRQRFTPEQIIEELREAAAALAQRAPGRQQSAGPDGMEAEKAFIDMYRLIPDFAPPTALTGENLLPANPIR
jgi:hypothetical protein